MSPALDAPVCPSRPPFAPLPEPPSRAPRGDGQLEEAMDRFSAGDDAAFADVYTRCAPSVRRWLSRLTKQPALAEDLAQETLLRMYRARTTWRPGSRVMPWARAIARRLFLDRLRQIRSEEAAHTFFTETGASGAFARADVQLAARRMAEVVSATPLPGCVMSLVLPRHLTCKEIVEITTLYAEGGLDEGDRARFEEHLATCGACIAYYDQMRLSAEAVKRLGDDPQDPAASLDPLVESALLRAFRGWPGPGG